MDTISRIESIALDSPAVTRSVQFKPVGQTDFGHLLGDGIEALNSKIAHAEHGVMALSLGEAVLTHELMIGMEKARFSLQFAVEFRSRLVEAYSEVTRMQI